jgi:ribosome assembly protein RRB1
MAKRPADSEQELEAIKNGDRPMEIDQDEVGDFEDEFEDEFESEDEIFEAGVDGRPDEEREAEERESMCRPLKLRILADNYKMAWILTKAPSYPAGTSSRLAKPSTPICPRTRCSIHSKHHGRVYHAT